MSIGAPSAQLLSIAQVAGQLHVCTRTVRRLIKAGRLVAVRLTPRLIRVDASSVTLLLEESRLRTLAEVASCRESGNTNTPLVSLTSPDSAAHQRTGTGGSTARRSASTPLTRRPLISASCSLPQTPTATMPQTAEEARKALRALRRAREERRS